MNSQGEGNAVQEGRQSADQAGHTGNPSQLLPVFADLQQRMLAAVKGDVGHELQDVSRAIAPDQDQNPVGTDDGKPGRDLEQEPAQYPSPPGLTLTLSRQDVQDGSRTLLQKLVDALFSDDQRAAVRRQSEEMLRSLLIAARKARPDAAAMKDTRQETERILDGMLDALFSEEARDQTVRDGERVIQALLRGDLPAAGRGGEQALLSLTERRNAMLTSHWEKIFQRVVKMVVAASGETDTAKAKSRSRSHAPDANDITMPQTIARSDKRAQTIWTRAYSRAAREQGEGRRAERAAYDALKQEYEKKGERWVKKP